MVGEGVGVGVSVGVALGEGVGVGVSVGVVVEVDVGATVGEGCITVGGTTVVATGGVPQAASKPSSKAIIKQMAKRGSRNMLYLGLTDCISPSSC